MVRSEEGPSSAKRRRRNNDDDRATSKRKHLYLALEDWQPQDGCSIYKLDADSMEPSGRLSGPAALRLAGPQRGRMAFAAVGTSSIVIDTMARPLRRDDGRAPSTLVYSTETGALAHGPRVPDEVRDLGEGMSASGRELGDWVLPFRGQAHFDADLDAWVGLHRDEDGHVCCCLVASRIAVATRPLECKVLKEKLFRSKQEVKPGHWSLKPTLTYMGDSRFCLVENVVHGEYYHEGSVIHVTLFGLQYDHKGGLQTKVRRIARSYEVSKDTLLFSHAAFWM
ncbi:hypothetical protein BAE44_0016042 [Dichanthelium oligosanthes]|uniref:Uncharacterized protein n=1 Tax=Dichanthelium oligosanthes TaxID=888268 RepID=A0A1E5VCR7_9POAL|nr:hypothetical protein BAE44_0016042 [Dichanthelium oligosanthes]